jgi:hypothetical protein
VRNIYLRLKGIPKASEQAENQPEYDDIIDVNGQQHSSHVKGPSNITLVSE